MPDERIDLISLQLCQALRYEQFDEEPMADPNGLPCFLIDRAQKNESIALHVHWNLYSEYNNNENRKEEQDYFKSVYDELMEELKFN